MSSKVINVVFGRDLKTVRSKRASVAPYTFIKNTKTGKYELFVLMGIHAKSGEVTDFGGGVKKDECDLQASLRELNEETFEMFNKVSMEYIESCVAITRPAYETVIKPTNTKVRTEGISTIFLPVSNEQFERASTEFKKLASNDSDREIREIMWVKGCEILKPTTKDYKVWSFLRKFYYESLSPELNEMLFARWCTSAPIV